MPPETPRVAIFSALNINPKTPSLTCFKASTDSLIVKDEDPSDTRERAPKRTPNIAPATACTVLTRALMGETTITPTKGTPCALLKTLCVESMKSTNIKNLKLR